MAVRILTRIAHFKPYPTEIQNNPSQKTTQKQSARRSHPFADTMKACRALPAYDKPFFVIFSTFLLSLRSSNLVHESGSKKRKNCFFLYVFF